MDRSACTQKRRCPFTQNPFAECYVMRLRSQDVGNAISYCGGAFNACEIYQEHVAGSIESIDSIDLIDVKTRAPHGLLEAIQAVARGRFDQKPTISGTVVQA